MIATDVVRRLLRQHPKLHPDSAAAGEFRSLGLGNLPFLEADENQPWGCFVDSPGEPLSPLPAFGLSPSKAADHFNSTTDLLLAEANRRDDPADVAATLKRRMGSDMVVCFLSSMKFRSPESEALAAALGKYLSQALPPPTALVCSGQPGAQRAFSKNCKDDSRLWHLVPYGQTSDSGVGQDLPCCHDAEEQRAVMGRLGDVYITIEGGPGVAEEASLAAENGAFVLPLQRSGGASEGMFDFPSAALQKPEWIHEDDWTLLCEAYAPVEASAAAAARIVAAYCNVSLEPEPAPPAVQQAEVAHRRSSGAAVPPSEAPSLAVPPQRPPAKPRVLGQPSQRPRNGNQQPRGPGQRASSPSMARGVQDTPREEQPSDEADDRLAALEAEEAELMREVMSLGKREEELLSKGNDPASPPRPSPKASPQLRGGGGPGRPPRPPGAGL